MYAPFFDAPPSLLRKPDGSVLFECICNGNPQPTIQWFVYCSFLFSERFSIVKTYGVDQSPRDATLIRSCHDTPMMMIKFFKDQELKDARHEQRIKKSVGKWTVQMIMKNPTQEDQGVYKVVATNQAGTHSVQQDYIHICTADEIFKTQ
ncbi:hypothetical protein DICVIV_09470 [Dictyocaulus viviparus]|uniref:Immunoglobulin I-set domain-containing protein n=1 Tax=Dictyocaulus viviparus TaxID=29172 RepID=A0A0D8XL15_DICVI|nr:hypothetical protein DICVIV_09470 [Dictyocaulus viviparus]